MKKLVHLVVELPDVGASDEEIQEAIEFQFGFRPNISVTNPLCMEIETLECYIENKDSYC